MVKIYVYPDQPQTVQGDRQKNSGWRNLPKAQVGTIFKNLSKQLQPEQDNVKLPEDQMQFLQFHPNMGTIDEEYPYNPKIDLSRYEEDIANYYSPFDNEDDKSTYQKALEFFANDVNPRLVEHGYSPYPLSVVASIPRYNMNEKEREKYGNWAGYTYNNSDIDKTYTVNKNRIDVATDIHEKTHWLRNNRYDINNYPGLVERQKLDDAYKFYREEYSRPKSLPVGYSLFDKVMETYLNKYNHDYKLITDEELTTNREFRYKLYEIAESKNMSVDEYIDKISDYELIKMLSYINGYSQLDYFYFLDDVRCGKTTWKEKADKIRTALKEVAYYNNDVQHVSPKWYRDWDEIIV